MSVESRSATPPAGGEGNLDTVARLGAQRRKFKDAAKRLTTERDEIKAELAKAKAELDDIRKTAPDTRIKELEAKLRETTHRARFNELAKEAGVKAKALQDLWEKSGYDAKGDAPDEAAIKAAIAKQREERDYLFDAGEPKPAAGDEAPPAPKPGPGRGQGGTASNDSGPLALTQEQLRDPAFMFRNQAKIAKAAQAALSLPKGQVAEALAIL
jgi:hypothetical protein